MITVMCCICGRKLFRYQKLGEGRLQHSWKKHISRDDSIPDRDC